MFLNFFPLNRKKTKNEITSKDGAIPGILARTMDTGV